MMPKEQSRTGAPESNGGPVDGAALLVRINVAQRHGADATSRYALISGLFRMASAAGLLSTRSRGPKQSSNKSVLSGLLLRGARDSEDGPRYEPRVIDHGIVSDPGQHLECRLGQALRECARVVRHRKQHVLL